MLLNGEPCPLSSWARGLLKMQCREDTDKTGSDRLAYESSRHMPFMFTDEQRFGSQWVFIWKENEKKKKEF